MNDEERINQIFSLYGLQEHQDCSCIKAAMRRTLYGELVQFAADIRADCARERRDLHELLDKQERAQSGGDE